MLDFHKNWLDHFDPTLPASDRNIMNLQSSHTPESQINCCDKVSIWLTP